MFMTFWQGLVISIVANTTVHVNATEWSLQVQNFLICLEMFFFSVAHFYVFPTEEWQEGYKPKADNDLQFGDNMALRDFVQDVKLILKSQKKKKKDNDVTPLDDDEDVFNASDHGLQLFAEEDDMEFISNVIKRADSLKLEESNERKPQMNSSVRSRNQGSETDEEKDLREII